MKLARLIISVAILFTLFAAGFPYRLSSVPAALQAPIFSPSLRLSDVATFGWIQDGIQIRGREPVIAIDNNTGYIYVAYMGRGLEFMRSLDGGTTFERMFATGLPSNTVGQGTHICCDPTLKVDSQGNIYLVYNAVYLVKSSDRGKTWQNPIAIDTQPDDDRPWIYVDANDYIYVTWVNVKTRNFYFSRSTDGGRTWSQPLVLTHTGGPSAPVTADGKGNVYAISNAETGLWFLRSKDYGQTFEPAVNLFANHQVWTSAIATDNTGSIYLVWSSYIVGSSSTTFNIYFSASYDNGQTWTSPRKLNDDNANVVHKEPWVASRDGRVHVVWMDTRDGEWGVYYTASNDKGRTFGMNLRVSDHRGGNASIAWTGADFIDIALDAEGLPHIVWSDIQGGIHDVYYARQQSQTTSTTTSLSTTTTTPQITTTATITTTITTTITMITTSGITTTSTTTTTTTTTTTITTTLPTTTTSSPTALTTSTTRPSLSTTTTSPSVTLTGDFAPLYLAAGTVVFAAVIGAFFWRRRR